MVACPGTVAEVFTAIVVFIFTKILKLICVQSKALRINILEASREGKSVA